MAGQKTRRRLLAATALGVSLLGLGAGPTAATLYLPGGTTVAKVLGTASVDTRTVCKTVYVIGATTPTVKVTLGGKTHTIDVSAFAKAAVKVCVDIGVDAAVVVNASVDTHDVLCPAVRGNVFVGASVTSGRIFVSVSGVDHHGLPRKVDTNALHLLPAGTSVDVPLLLVVCDP